MTNLGKPSGFWMGRVVAATAIHFMLFGMAAMYVGTTTWCIASDYPPLYPFIHALYTTLSLPLIAPLKEGGIGAALFYLPFGIPALVALIVYAVNSFIWGFAVDAYLRIMGRVCRLWRGRPT